jgi:hypothetical protein
MAGRARSTAVAWATTRQVVERSLSWLGKFRRLKLCYERFGEHFQAFHELAACLLCANRVEQLSLDSSGF